MIVQPDFVDHWKTRLLVQLTGDSSAPLALLRLWGYCQTSRKSFFPDMTPAQLASVCHWGDRKPACHVALVKCRFLDKLSPGYAVHQWNEFNAKLLANWENGKLGGRPKRDENPNEINETRKPVGSFGLTQSEPIEQIEQIDKIEQRDRTEQTTVQGSVVFASNAGSSVPIGFTPPTLEMVKACMEAFCKGSGEFADQWLKTMTRQEWKDDKGKPVRKWTALAISYAGGCMKRKR
jgi:hypothetical protein